MQIGRLTERFTQLAVLCVLKVSMPKVKEIPTASMEEEDEDDEEMEEDETESNETTSVYLPSQPLEEGERLVCDTSAYKMLHRASSGSPCLSFDIIRDRDGDNRETFPLSAYIVAGTQAPKTHTNNLFVMKMSNLHATVHDEDVDNEEEDDDEEDPEMKCARIKHQGCVNRIRCTEYGGQVIAATWSELGRVNVWDLTRPLQAVESTSAIAKYNNEGHELSTKALFTFQGHQKEGYALDWCTTEPGKLASGDCRRDIHIWKPAEGGKWIVNQRPLVGHEDSVEDLQWSPNEKNILASCSVDKSIRIWDLRADASKANMLTVANSHESDVNVISWNRNEPFICSGGDDGVIHVWDLRQLKGSDSAVATFKHHTAPLTSVEWHPTDPTVFASAGQDNQIALWDLSLEKDGNEEELEDVPPQLLFIHQGQKDLKELHWHPQLPGVIVSTSLSGFNIFRTISV